MDIVYGHSLVKVITTYLLEHSWGTRFYSWGTCLVCPPALRRHWSNDAGCGTVHRSWSMHAVCMHASIYGGRVVYYC